jgi:hypothetical protein
MDYGREILLRDADGIPALWIYQYADGRRTINDCNTEAELEPDADIDEEIRLWKAAVGWDDPNGRISWSTARNPGPERAS